MNWMEVFTIIGVLGGFTMWLFQRLDSDIKELSGKIDTETKTIHRRIDQLYQIIIDLMNKN